MKDIPEDVEKFLQSEYGVSLLIKGLPGSGKTTLSLQILEKMKGARNAMYISTRLGDVSLYNQFPWLKEAEKNIKLIIMSKLFVETINKKNEKNSVDKIAKEMLTGMKNKQRYVSRYMYEKTFREILSPEVERIYDEVESQLPKQSIVVIDSIEGITIPYSIEASNFMYMIQKDLIENAGTTVVFVSEKNDIRPEDYIADGVLYMDYESSEDFNGNILRYLKIKKLRGFKINSSKQIFTLENGKIGIFDFPSQRKGKSGKFYSYKNDNKYSTGIKDLDNLLNGGIKPGNILTFNVSENTTFSNFWLVNKPLFLNALLNNMGIILIGIPSHSFSSSVENICQDIGFDVCDSKTRFVNYLTLAYYKKSLIDEILIDKDSISINDYKVLNELNKISENNRYPVLFYVDFPSIENVKGILEAKKELIFMTNYIRSSNKHIGVIFSNDNLEIKNEVKSLSNYYINVITMEGTPFIYGVKPQFGLYGVMPDGRLGLPNVKLIQIV
ncbi:MAG: RAD55 family ATPase [Thermoplasmata archaeon]